MICVITNDYTGSIFSSVGTSVNASELWNAASIDKQTLNLNQIRVGIRYQQFVNLEITRISGKSNYKILQSIYDNNQNEV